MLDVSKLPELPRGNQFSIMTLLPADLINASEFFLSKADDSVRV